MTLKAPQWTILKLLGWTTSFFKSHDIDSPRLTAEILLAQALGIDRIDLYVRYDQPLSEQELAAFKTVIKRRVQREPVAYISGRKEFFGLVFDVTPDVLIPRPDTETLVEAALELIPRGGTRPFRIIDLGTGSGAIILALADSRPGHVYFGSDISYSAVRLARKNADRHGLNDKIHFFTGDWLNPVSAATPGFDMIVSNPPYIPTGQIPALEPEIHRYEPIAALDGAADGLMAVKTILAQAPIQLRPGGFLLVEIGYDQGTAVRRMAEAAGIFSSISIRKDYGGNDRVALLQK